MLRRSLRLLPILALALLAAAFGASAIAVADDRDGSHGDHRGDHRDWDDDDGARHHSDDDGDDHARRGHEGLRGLSCGHRSRLAVRSSKRGRRVAVVDALWLKRHIQTNLFEIAGGQAAQAKATAEPVRAFAAQLVADHTAALEQATALAERLGVRVPDEPSPLQRWALRAVAEFQGAAFDRWFLELQVEGHRQAIAETKLEVVAGCHPKVRRLAKAVLPVLKAHLEHARTLLGDSD